MKVKLAFQFWIINSFFRNGKSIKYTHLWKYIVCKEPWRQNRWNVFPCGFEFPLKCQSNLESLCSSLPTLIYLQKDLYPLKTHFQNWITEQNRWTDDKWIKACTQIVCSFSELGFGHEMSIEQLTKLLAEEIEYLEDNSRWADPQ